MHFLSWPWKVFPGFVSSPSSVSVQGPGDMSPASQVRVRRLWFLASLFTLPWASVWLHGLGHLTVILCDGCSSCAQSLSRVWLFRTPWTVTCQGHCPRDFPGKNTGVGCHALLQRIFPTQGLNPSLLPPETLLGAIFKNARASVHTHPHFLNLPSFMEAISLHLSQHLLDLWPWVNFLLLSSLSCLICKVGITREWASLGCCAAQWHNVTCYPGVWGRQGSPAAKVFQGGARPVRMTSEFSGRKTGKLMETDFLLSPDWPGGDEGRKDE